MAMFLKLSTRAVFWINGQRKEDFYSSRRKEALTFSRVARRSKTETRRQSSGNIEGKARSLAGHKRVLCFVLDFLSFHDPIYT